MKRDTVIHTLLLETRVHDDQSKISKRMDETKDDGALGFE